VAIDGIFYDCQNGTVSVDLTLSGNSTVSFVVIDPTGLLYFRKNDQVTITDEGFSYQGFVHDTKIVNQAPSTTNFITVNCQDMRYVASKRYYSGAEYIERFAGDVVADTLSNTLSSEGVTSNYASQVEQTYLDWVRGEQVGLVASNTLSGGNLELQPAGQDIEFDLPVATKLSMNAIKLTGYCSSGYSSAYAYVTIWTGDQLVSTICSLVYDMWISSSSPEIKAGVDILLQDGTSLSSYPFGVVENDAQNISADPKNDLSGFANDQWYSRSIAFNLTGNSIKTVSIALGGSAQGNYTAYFRRIRLVDASGDILQTFFDDTYTEMPVCFYTIDTGYSNLNAEVVTAYDKETIATFVNDLTLVQIIKSSVVLYGQKNPITTLSNASGTILLETSLDQGISYQLCINGKTIPNLFAGANVSGQSLTIRQTIIQGIYADEPTDFSFAHFIITTSYAANIPSFIQTIYSASQFNAGNLFNTMVFGDNGIQLPGSSILWNSIDDLNGTTMIGVGSTIIDKRMLAIGIDGNSDVKLRLDKIGSWQNFTAEVACTIPAVATDNTGIVYRTTFWGDLNDSYAYNVFLNQTQVAIGLGSNTAVSFFLLLASSPIALTANSQHTLKVQALDSQHTVWLDGVKLIQVTDSTFTGSGQIGLRYYNSTTTTPTSGIALYQNFGITSSYTGSWDSPAYDLSFVGIYGHSFITWDISGLSANTNIVVNTSVDDLQTAQPCTRDAPIPNLQVGQNLKGKKLYVSVYLSTGNAYDLVNMKGITIWISPLYSASGAWMSIPLSIDTVGTIGKGYISWFGNVYQNTSLAIDTSLDGENWTTAGTTASNDVAISLLTSQPEVYVDSFAEDSTTNYLSTSGTILSGGGV
jgi:hypothetical protein